MPWASRLPLGAKEKSGEGIAQVNLLIVSPCADVFFLLGNNHGQLAVEQASLVDGGGDLFVFKLRGQGVESCSEFAH